MVSDTSERSIRTIRQEFNKAILLHNSTNIADFCTEDFVCVTSLNFEIKGNEGMRMAFEKEFSSKKGIFYVRTPIDIQVFEAWNMASEIGEWTGQWQESDGLVELSGTYYAKWHKINGLWKIRAEIFTPLSCSGNQFCHQAPVLQ